MDSNVDSRNTFREYWVLIFGLMSSDSELFIVSNVCPGRSTPCWGWPAPPAPSSSPCPAGTRASSPGPASRGDTCSVTCHVASRGHDSCGYRSWRFLLHYSSILVLWSVNKNTLSTFYCHSPQKDSYNIINKTYDLSGETLFYKYGIRMRAERNLIS